MFFRKNYFNLFFFLMISYFSVFSKDINELNYGMDTSFSFLSLISGVLKYYKESGSFDADFDCLISEAVQKELNIWNQEKNKKKIDKKSDNKNVFFRALAEMAQYYKNPFYVELLSIVENKEIEPHDKKNQICERGATYLSDFRENRNEIQQHSYFFEKQIDEKKLSTNDDSVSNTKFSKPFEEIISTVVSFCEKDKKVLCEKQCESYLSELSTDERVHFIENYITLQNKKDISYYEIDNIQSHLLSKEFWHELSKKKMTEEELQLYREKSKAFSSMQSFDEQIKDYRYAVEYGGGGGESVASSQKKITTAEMSTPDHITRLYQCNYDDKQKLKELSSTLKNYCDDKTEKIKQEVISKYNSHEGRIKDLEKTKEKEQVELEKKIRKIFQEEMKQELLKWKVAAAFCAVALLGYVVYKNFMQHTE